MAEYLVIAGLSGAGRSEAAKDFEDLGWFVIDNLPPSLIPKVRDLVDDPGSSTERVVLVAGGGQPIEALIAGIEGLRDGHGRVRVLYLESSTRELVRRYEQTRRRHPHSDGTSLERAIEVERALLEPVRATADVIVDTTDLNVHQLRDQLRATFGEPGADKGMQTVIRSFGFKHGLPLDADLVFDVRFLPNPHWEDDLRPLTGCDEPVRDFVLGQRDTAPFLDHLVGLFELLLPAYRAEGKSHLSVAVGCTGGRHRSVAIAEALAARLDDLGSSTEVVHRDIARSDHA